MAIDWVHRGGAFAQAQTYVVSIGMFCSALSFKHVHGAAVSDAEYAVVRRLSRCTMPSCCDRSL